MQGFLACTYDTRSILDLWLYGNLLTYWSSREKDIQHQVRTQGPILPGKCNVDVGHKARLYWGKCNIILMRLLRQGMFLDGSSTFSHCFCAPMSCRGERVYLCQVRSPAVGMSVRFLWRCTRLYCRAESRCGRLANVFERSPGCLAGVFFCTTGIGRV